MVDTYPELASQSKALARRKVIYLTIHPETKRGGTPGRAGGGKNAKVDRLATFATDAATKTGRSARTVRRLVAIGEKLDEEAAETLADTYRP